MPGGDRSGPGGMGPRTGRAAGFCAGSGMPGYENGAPGWRAGRGRAGRGRLGGSEVGSFGGRGWRRGGFPGGDPREAGEVGGFGPGRRWRHWFRATGLPERMRFPGFGAASSAGGPATGEAVLERRIRALEEQLQEARAQRDQATPETAGE